MTFNFGIGILVCDMSDKTHITPRTLGSTFDACDEVCRIYEGVDFVRMTGAVASGHDIRPNRRSRIYDIVSKYEMRFFDDGYEGPGPDDQPQGPPPEVWADVVQEVLGTDHYKISNVTMDQSLKAAKMLMDYTARHGASGNAQGAGAQAVEIGPVDVQTIRDTKAIFDDNF